MQNGSDVDNIEFDVLIFLSLYKYKWETDALFPRTTSSYSKDIRSILKYRAGPSKDKTNKIKMIKFENFHILFSHL